MVQDKVVQLAIERYKRQGLSQPVKEERPSMVFTTDNTDKAFKQVQQALEELKKDKAEARQVMKDLLKEMDTTAEASRRQEIWNLLLIVKDTLVGIELGISLRRQELKYFYKGGR